MFDSERQWHTTITVEKVSRFAVSRLWAVSVLIETLKQAALLPETNDFVV